MNITTSRCLLRDFILEDIYPFMSYHNNLSWMKYQGFKGLSEKEYREILLTDTSFRKGKQLAIILKENNVLIGDIYLKKEDNIWWIGYSIHPDYARRGYIKEVVLALKKWLITQGATQINAAVAPKNVSSCHLLQDLGFSLLKKEAEEWLFFYSLEKGGPNDTH